MEGLRERAGARLPLTRGIVGFKLAAKACRCVQASILQLGYLKKKPLREEEAEKLKKKHGVDTRQAVG